MALVSRRNGTHWPLVRFEDAFADMMQRFFDPRGWLAAAEWWPALHVSEKDDAIVVRAEVPGMKSEDIEVSVQGNALTISGEKKEQFEDKGKTHYRSERRYGSFRRNIPLPSAVNTDAIKATCRDSVLTITLPKSEQAKSKRIQVKET